MPKPKNKKTGGTRIYPIREPKKQENQPSESTVASAKAIKVGEKKKRNGGRSLPKKSETKGKNQYSNGNGSRRQFGDAQRDEMQYQVAKNPATRFGTNFSDAVLDNSLAGSAYSLIAGAATGEGQKWSNGIGASNPYNQLRTTGSGSGLGRFTGTMFDYAMQYKLMNPLFEKGAEAIMNGTRLGDAIRNSSRLGKIGQEAGAILGAGGGAKIRTAEDVGKSLLSATIGDATLGLAQNFAMDYGGEGLRGEDLANQMFIDELADFGLGGLMEMAPYKIGKWKNNRLLNGKGLNNLLKSAKGKDKYLEALGKRLAQLNRTLNASQYANGAGDMARRAFDQRTAILDEIRKVEGMDDVAFGRYQGKIPAEAEVPTTEVPTANAPTPETVQPMSHNRAGVESLQKGSLKQKVSDKQWKGMSWDDVKKLCKEHGIPIKGKRADLINKLKENGIQPNGKVSEASSVKAETNPEYESVIRENEELKRRLAQYEGGAQPQAEAPVTPEQPTVPEAPAETVTIRNEEAPPAPQAEAPSGTQTKAIDKKSAKFKAWEHYNKAELKAILEKYGLPKGGSREQKVQALIDAGIEPPYRKGAVTANVSEVAQAPVETRAQATAEARTETPPKAEASKGVGDSFEEYERVFGTRPKTEPTIEAKAEAPQAKAEEPIKAEEPAKAEEPTKSEAKSEKHEELGKKTTNAGGTSYEASYGLTEDGKLYLAENGRPVLTANDTPEARVKAQEWVDKRIADAEAKAKTAETPSGETGKPLPTREEVEATQAKVENTTEPISDRQAKFIERLYKDNNADVSKMLEGRGIKSLNELSKKDASEAINKILAWEKAHPNSVTKWRSYKDKDLKKLLDSRNIGYDSKATRDELIEKVNSARLEPNANGKPTYDKGSLDTRRQRLTGESDKAKSEIVKFEDRSPREKSRLTSHHNSLPNSEGKLEAGQRISFRRTGKGQVTKTGTVLGEKDGKVLIQFDDKTTTSLNDGGKLYQSQGVLKKDGKKRYTLTDEQKALLNGEEPAKATPTPETAKTEAEARLTIDTVIEKQTGKVGDTTTEFSYGTTKDGRLYLAENGTPIAWGEDTPAFREEASKWVKERAESLKSEAPTPETVKAEAEAPIKNAEAETPKASELPKSNELPNEATIKKWQKYTKNDIKKLLDEKGIEYKKSKNGETKATLIAKAESAGIEPPQKTVNQTVKAEADALDIPDEELTSSEKGQRTKLVNRLSDEYADYLAQMYDVEGSEFIQAGEEATDAMLKKFEAEIVKDSKSRPKWSDILDNLNKFEEMHPNYVITDPRKKITRRQWRYIAEFFGKENADIMQRKVTKNQLSVFIDTHQAYLKQHADEMAHRLRTHRVSQTHLQMLENYFGDNQKAIDEVLNRYTITKEDVAKAKRTKAGDDLDVYKPNRLNDLSEADYQDFIQRLRDADDEIAKNSSKIDLGKRYLKVGDTVAQQTDQGRIAVGRITHLETEKIGNEYVNVATIEFPSKTKDGINTINKIFVDKMPDKYSLITDENVSLTTAEGWMPATDKFAPDKGSTSSGTTRSIGNNSNYVTADELQASQDAWLARRRAEAQRNAQRRNSLPQKTEVEAPAQVETKAPAKADAKVEDRWYNATTEPFNEKTQEYRVYPRYSRSELGLGGRRNLEDWDFTEYNSKRREARAQRQTSDWNWEQEYQAGLDARAARNADATVTTTNGGTPTSSIDTDWTATNGGTHTYTNTETSKALPNKKQFNLRKGAGARLKDYGNVRPKGKGAELPKGKKVSADGVKSKPLSANSSTMDVQARFGESTETKELFAIERELQNAKKKGDVSQSLDTFIHSRDIDNRTKRAILNLQDNLNAFGKKTIRNKDVLAKAERMVADDFEGTLKSFEKRVADEMQFTSEDNAIAYHLMQKMMRDGNVAQAAEIASKVSSAESAVGRGLQSMRMWHACTPEGRVASVLRNIKKLEKRFAKRNVKIEIGADGEAILKRIFDAKTDEELYKASNDFAVHVWNQIPPSLSEKVTAWRYLSMLYNPKTWIRNGLGNIAMMGTKRFSDVLATGVERAFTKTSYYKKLEGADKLNGTHAILNRFDEVDKARYNLGREQFKKYRDKILAESSKYFDNARPIESPTFKNRLARHAMKFNDIMLNGGDVIFMRPNYANSFAQYLKANNIKASDITDEVLEQANKYAQEMAMRTTFRDANKLADALNGFRQKLEPNVNDDLMMRVGRAGARLVTDATVPFVRTPMNILKRGTLEYSPVGLVRGIAQIVNAKSAKEAIDGVEYVANGITGTGLFALGYWLCNRGVLTGSSGEYDKKTAYDSMLGEQSYAVVNPNSGNSYTVDWVVPDALPLFMGVQLSTLLGEAGANDDRGWAMLDSLKDMADPIFELSMLQGIENTFQMTTQGEKGLGDIVLNASSGYVSQFIPTVIGQASRTFVLNRKTAVSTAQSSTQRKVEKLIGKLINKTPFSMWVDDYSSQDYVDSWGRTDSKSTGVQGTRNLWTWESLENFFSPGYYAKENKTDVDKEILALYDRLGTENRDKVIPSVNPSAYIQKLDDKEYTMTPAEFTQYKKTVGQYKYKGLEKLFATTAYQNASDDEKRKMIQDVYDEASEYGRREYLSKVDEDFASAPDFYMLDTKTREKYSNTLSVSEQEWASAYNDMLDTADERKTETGTTLTANEKRYILMSHGLTSYEDAQSILGESTSKNAWQEAYDEYKTLRKQYPSDSDFRDAIEQKSIEERELEEKRANMEPNERTYDTYFTTRAKERYDGKTVSQDVYDAYLKEAWYVDQHNPNEKDRNGTIRQSEAYTAIVNLSKKYNLTQAQKAYLWALSETENGWKKKPFG